MERAIEALIQASLTAALLTGGVFALRHLAIQLIGSFIIYQPYISAAILLQV